MPDPFDDIDPGQDFEDFAVGLSPVTVTRVDPDTGAAGAAVEDVPATKLIRKRRNGEQVAEDTVEFVFRANRLEFTPKAKDLITDSAAVVWVVTDAGLEAFESLCRAQCVKQR